MNDKWRTSDKIYAFCSLYGISKQWKNSGNVQLVLYTGLSCRM